MGVGIGTRQARLLGRRQANWVEAQDSSTWEARLENDSRRSGRSALIRLYLDTSCLAKLFVTESDSEIVHRVVQNASAVATSVVSYVEMMSALNRRQREGVLMPAEYKRTVEVFEADWRRYLKI